MDDWRRFLLGGMHFLSPCQRCQSTKGNSLRWKSPAHLLCHLPPNCCRRQPTAETRDVRRDVTLFSRRLFDVSSIHRMAQKIRAIGHLRVTKVSLYPQLRPLLVDFLGLECSVLDGMGNAL